MEPVRLALFASLVLTALVGCSDDAPIEEDAVPSTATKMPTPRPDAGTVDAAPQRTPTDTTGVVVTSGDAGPAACQGTAEKEPNDEDRRAPLPPVLCGALGGGDVDAFTTSTGSADRTLRFEASGDAELEAVGFGSSRTLKSGEELTIPAFPLPLAFAIVVKSRSGTPQSYRISSE